MTVRVEINLGFGSEDRDARPSGPKPPWRRRRRPPLPLPPRLKSPGATYSSPEMRKYMSTSPLTPIETEVGNDKLPFEMVDEEQSEHQCVKLAELRSHK